MFGFLYLFFSVFSARGHLNLMILPLTRFCNFFSSFFFSNYWKTWGILFISFSCFPLSFNKYQYQGFFNPFEWDMEENEVRILEKMGVEMWECVSIMVLWLSDTIFWATTLIQNVIFIKRLFKTCTKKHFDVFNFFRKFCWFQFLLTNGFFCMLSDFVIPRKLFKFFSLPNFLHL